MMKHLLWLLLLGRGPALGQTAPAAPAVAPAIRAAAWAAQVQPLPPAAQLAALRGRLRGEAARPLRQGPPTPVCTMHMTAAQRAAWTAARRQLPPDTANLDYLLVYIINGHPVNAHEAATAVAAVPAPAVERLTILTGTAAGALFGSHGSSGAVLITLSN